MSQLRLVAFAAAVTFLLAICSGEAFADSIGWSGSVDGNNVENLSGQLGLDVTVDSGVVTFCFTNAIGTASSITEIYFSEDLEDWLDLTTLGIKNTTTASTTPELESGEGNPGSPPGLNSFVVGASKEAAADSGNGGPTKGIDESGDKVTITFDLVDGASFADLVDALNGVRDPKDALVAVHVRSIGVEDGSDTYYTANPEPSTFALMGFALVAAAAARRRRMRRAA